jgi:hypothetical protein
MKPTLNNPACELFTHSFWGDGTPKSIRPMLIAPRREWEETCSHEDEDPISTNFNIFGNLAN